MYDFDHNSKPKAEKNVERLGPNTGYERETSKRKQASEAGRLLWFLVGAIIIAHYLGVKGKSVTGWGNLSLGGIIICGLRGNLSGCGEHHLGRSCGY